MNPAPSISDALVLPKGADGPRNQGGDSPDNKLEALLGRLRTLTGQTAAALRGTIPDSLASASRDPSAEFRPVEPQSLDDTGISEPEVAALAMKFLLKSGGATGRKVAAQIRLPFSITQGVLAQMKADRRIVYKNAADSTDYFCELTGAGAEHARRHYEHSTYCGSVPVPLSDYVTGVASQSITNQHPEIGDVERALGDLSVSPRLVSRITQAIRAGRGMFLYGAPGNGKTSVAERITRAFGQTVWIPRAVSIDGEIVKLFDPCCHEELPPGFEEQFPKCDARWIRIRRPTVIAGGELTMDRLEVTLNRQTGVCEASVQMKSNCGTLVIDDFGRQRMPINELLNRWIVPLEKRYDYINLPSGRAVQIPFDQLIVFSTNLEPRSLVDEAFLRRIPYKIDFTDPTEEVFHSLFDLAAEAFGFQPSREAVEDLIERHYRPINRPFRFCQPRDLVKQVRHYCEVHRVPLQLTPEAFDVAVENYFSVMQDTAELAMASVASSTDQHDDADSRGFIPIALDTLLPSAMCDFDLYLRQIRGGTPTLYRRRDLPLAQSDLDRLIAQGVRTLHVLYDERDLYANYLKALLVSQQQFTPIQKYKILKAAARSILSDNFCGGSLDTHLASVDTLSQQLVDSICNDDLLLRDVFQLMTHDYYSYTHVTNVSTYSLALAQALGMSQREELVELVSGALLHDIGKRHLPPGLLNKPGKLTPQETVVMRQHPQKGFEELCMRSDLSWAQLMMVYQHHERLDGSGYPVGIAEEEIHPWAKICAVADVFDALTSTRPYRKPNNSNAALEFFERRAGLAFDAEIVRCLRKLMRES